MGLDIVVGRSELEMSGFVYKGSTKSMSPPPVTNVTQRDRGEAIKMEVMVQEMDSAAKRPLILAKVKRYSDPNIMMPHPKLGGK